MVIHLIKKDFIQRIHLYFLLVNWNQEFIALVFFNQPYPAYHLQIVNNSHYLLLLLVKLLELDHYELQFVLLIFELGLLYVNRLLLPLPLPPLMLQPYHHLCPLFVLGFKIIYFDALVVLMLSRLQMTFLNVRVVLVVVDSFHFINYQINFDQHRHFEIKHLYLFLRVFSYYSKLVTKFHFHHFKQTFLIHLATFLF